MRASSSSNPSGRTEMQLRAGIGAQADGVTRVGRNLGANEDDVEHGQEKVSGEQAGRARSRTAPVRNCRRFLHGGRPRPGRCAQPGSYPCLSAERARPRIQAAHDPRPGVRATASTITLSAPAANRAWAAASAVLPVVITSSTNATCRPRTPCPRNTPARAARRSRRPSPACRGVSRRRSSARPQRQIQRGRQAAGDLHGRVHAAPTQSPAGRHGSQHRIGRQGCLPGDGRPSRRASTGASDRRSRVFNDRSGPRPAARSRMPRWRAGRRAAGSGSPRTAGRLAQALRAAQTTRARLTAATGDVGLAARAQARARTRAPHSGQSQPMADASRDHSCRPRASGNRDGRPGCAIMSAIPSSNHVPPAPSDAGATEMSLPESAPAHPAHRQRRRAAPVRAPWRLSEAQFLWRSRPPHAGPAAIHPAGAAGHAGRGLWRGRQPAAAA